MTSTSSFRRSLPTSRRSVSVSVRAVNFLRAVKDRNAGRIEDLPISGCRSAKFDKVEPFSERAMNVHDVVALLADSSDTESVDYGRALFVDAGKAHVIVKIAGIAAANDMDTAELQLVECEARFTSLLDMVRHRAQVARTNLHDAEVAVEVAARAAEITAEARQ